MYNTFVIENVQSGLCLSLDASSTWNKMKTCPRVELRKFDVSSSDSWSQYWVFDLPNTLGGSPYLSDISSIRHIRTAIDQNFCITSLYTRPYYDCYVTNESYYKLTECAGFTPEIRIIPAGSNQYYIRFYTGSSSGALQLYLGQRSAGNSTYAQWIAVDNQYGDPNQKWIIKSWTDIPGSISNWISLFMPQNMNQNYSGYSSGFNSAGCFASCVADCLSYYTKKEFTYQQLISYGVIKSENSPGVIYKSKACKVEKYSSVATVTDVIAILSKYTPAILHISRGEQSGHYITAYGYYGNSASGILVLDPSNISEPQYDVGRYLTLSEKLTSGVKFDSIWTLTEVYI